MSISIELASFYENWRAKANAYSTDSTRGAFDRFFTLYVLFNRLYAEATFRLARRGSIKLRDRLPDSNASQAYVLQFCGSKTLIRAWESDPGAVEALRQIADHLRQGRFHLKLNMVTGEPQPAEDKTLLAAMESRGQNRRALAVLEALYAIRCNMFHGHKAFEPIQLDLLRPAIVLLDSTINALHQVLDNEN